MNTNTNATATAAKSNVKSFEDYLARAVELGGLEGQGRDSQIKFAMELVEGAYLGVFNLDKNRRGANKDDAAAMSEKYFMSKKGSSVFDLSARNIQKLCSTHRRCIQLGCTPKWGKGQPLQITNEFVDQWMRFRKELDPKSSRHPSNGLKMNDAFNAFQLFITAQMKSASLLTASEYKDLMFIKVADPKTEVEKLEAARKMLQKSGDTSAQVQAAVHSITMRLANIAKGIK